MKVIRGPRIFFLIFYFEITLDLQKVAKENTLEPHELFSHLSPMVTLFTISRSVNWHWHVTIN